MDFEWDTEKADANVVKHGVSFAEASTIFGDEFALTIFDPDHSSSEDRYITMPNDPDPSEMREHHEFGPAENPVKGKYLEKYRQGTSIVVIAPDLARRFPDSDAVNAALRKLIDLVPDAAPGG